MRKANVIMIMAVMLITLSACEESQRTTTGFLTDYSRLQQVSDTTLRYLPSQSLAGYSKFIIDPVTVHFHAGAKGAKASSTETAHLKQYMYAEIRKAISDRYSIVTQAGPGVARVRVALTDIKESKTIQNIIPMAKLAGTGLGGASMEAELIDSQTGRQIAAIVETQSGNRLSLDGLSKWGDAEAVMKGWAQRFRKRLDEAHAR